MLNDVLVLVFIKKEKYYIRNKSTKKQNIYSKNQKGRKIVILNHL